MLYLGMEEDDMEEILRLMGQTPLLNEEYLEFMLNNEPIYDLTVEIDYDMPLREYIACVWNW